ncbi:MAG TPA: hypothetical protein PLX89_26165, partial [Verrucomicrobiota bacterium]|nr:hypothetical protein [Verrucomicrobiota bacterium]
TPVASLSLTKPGTSLILNWSNVPAATSGYRVYQASSASSQTWNSITNLPAGTTQWTVPADTSLNGSNAFMIKCRELKSNGSGSYHNLSVGTISNELNYP